MHDYDSLIEQFVSGLEIELIVAWAHLLEVEVNPPPLGDMWPDWEGEIREEVGDAMRKIGAKCVAA